MDDHATTQPPGPRAEDSWAVAARRVRTGATVWAAAAVVAAALATAPSPVVRIAVLGWCVVLAGVIARTARRVTARWTSEATFGRARDVAGRGALLAAAAVAVAATSLGSIVTYVALSSFPAATLLLVVASVPLYLLRQRFLWGEGPGAALSALVLPVAGLLPAAAFAPPSSLPAWTWVVVFWLIPLATITAADQAFPDEV